ncbi:hypothetical protein RIB2604_01808790 [Aspergillus luchuensis]|uniref:Uncharacterized protein n=1 Tax=Aspergillus kawachii TaxID=1069201 RepID=A0A146FI80_ASPKA|nr:hypothetical protein RIB2604_01808790 [Aspergillus luchuensis]
MAALALNIPQMRWPGREHSHIKKAKNALHVRKSQCRID